MTPNPYRIFKNVKVGEKFVTHPVGSIVFTKVKPAETNNGTCNAISDSGVYSTWIYNAEMVVIQEDTNDN